MKNDVACRSGAGRELGCWSARRPPRIISVGVAGPMTGRRGLVRTPAQERRRSGGRRHQRCRRRARQEAQARGRRRRLRSQAGARGRREVRQRETAVRRRALLLVVLDPGVGGLRRGRRAADHARPRPIRPSPSATSGTRSASAAVTTSRARWPAITSPRTIRARTSPSFRTRPTYGKGLADEMKKALNTAGAQGEDVRGLYQGRQGLQRAGLQDEGATRSMWSMSAAITPKPA